MDETGHRRRSATGSAVTVAELAARLRPEPEPSASAAGPVGTSLSVGQLLQREGQGGHLAAARSAQPRSRHAAEPSPTEAPPQPRSRRTSRSLALGAAVAGAAMVSGSVLAGGLIGGLSDKRDPGGPEKVFNPDGTSAGQHKAAIPTASAQVIRPIPAATPQSSPTTAVPLSGVAARAPVTIGSAPPSSGGSAMGRPGVPGTWTPPPSRDAPEGDRSPASRTTPPTSPTTKPPPSEDPDESGGSEQPDPGPADGNAGGSGDSGSGDSGSGDTGSGDPGSDEESGGDGSPPAGD